MRWLTPLLVACLLSASYAAERMESYTENIAALISPEKLATLRSRASSPRIKKAVALMEDSKRAGFDVATVASNAVVLAGYTNALLAELTRDSLVRNHAISEKLGVLTDAGLADLRRGQAPTIAAGPSTGDELSTDHIIPVEVAPELDNVIANLELLPLKVNTEKGDKIGDRQRALARQLHEAAVITQSQLERIVGR